MAGLPKNKPSDVWRNIDKRGHDECWPWQGTIAFGNYGVLRIEGRYYKAHRVVYALEHPEIALSAPKDVYESKFVLHRCDNPQCCNPGHLYLGNIWDNMRDKVARNRCYHGGPGKRQEA